jgi:hypothetical protein
MSQPERLVFEPVARPVPNSQPPEQPIIPVTMNGITYYIRLGRKKYTPKTK